MTIIAAAPPPEPVHLDFETCSVADLTKAGAVRYATDPSTRVVCLAWAIGNGPVHVWNRLQPLDPATKSALLHLAVNIQRGAEVHAWNAAFDVAVWNAKVAGFWPSHFLTFPVIRDEQVRCVMARALYWGLPASLDAAAPALGLSVSKNKAGHALMKRMARPRSVDPHTKNPVWWHETDAAKLTALMDYCRQDVEVERAVAHSLPPLPEAEQSLWLLDHQANQRGLRLDRRLIGELSRVSNEARLALNWDIVTLTGNQVPSLTATGKLLAWMQARGYPAGDLRRNTLIETLPLLSGPVRQAARLRLEAARTSTAKLDRMKACMDPRDDRVRGVVQFYGAGRTGRWAGRLIQPQNFPRGTVKNVDFAVQQVLDGATPADLEMFHPDSALGVVASLLRATIIPRPSHKLISADLAQIEARVIAWLAGQWDILDVFAQGKDVYTYTVRKIGGTDRQLGKGLVLGCGFGMGPPKFQATVAAPPYRLKLSAQEAEDAVRAWRAANPRIVSLWYEYGDAALKIARGRHGDVVRCRQGVVFERRKNTMLITLPSGRQLVYRNIGIARDPTGWDQVEYDGVDQRTRKWTRIRTYGGKLAENVTQAVARDAMAETLRAMARAGMKYLLTVHDEVIAEVPSHDAARALDWLLTQMRTPPAWARGLPVNAEGHVLDRYRK